MGDDFDEIFRPFQRLPHRSTKPSDSPVGGLLR